MSMDLLFHKMRPEEREIIYGMESSLPGITDFCDEFLKYEEVLLDKLNQDDKIMECFLQNPYETTMRMVDLPQEQKTWLKNLEQKVRKTGITDSPFAMEKKKPIYVPPTKSFAEPWDMIDASSLDVVNKALELFAKSRFSQRQHISFEHGGTTYSCAFTLSAVSIVKLDNSEATLSLSLKDFELSVSKLQEKDADNTHHVSFITLKVETALEKILLSADKDGKPDGCGSDMFYQVFLSLGPNAVTAISVDVTDRPDEYSRKKWTILVTLLNVALEELLDYFHKLAAPDPEPIKYLLFQVPVDEKNSKVGLPTAIPSQVTFSSSTTGDERKYIIVYGEIDPQKDISGFLKITPGTISSDNQLLVCQDMAMEQIFGPALEEQVLRMSSQKRLDGKHIFNYSQSVLTIPLNFTVNPPVIDGWDFTKLGIDLKSLSLQMIDGGFYTTLNFHTKVLVQPMDGVAYCNLSVRINDGVMTVEAKVPPYIVLNTNFNLLWAFICYGPFGILVDLIMNLLVSFIHPTIDINRSFSLEPVVLWNHLEISEVVTLELRDGLNAGFVMSYTE